MVGALSGNDPEVERVTREHPAAGLRSAKPSWTAGLVLVCRSCDGYSKALRRGLRAALAEAGLRKRVRVVACGCLDVCPKGATAVVTATTGISDCSIVRGADADTLASLARRFERGPNGKKTTGALPDLKERTT